LKEIIKICAILAVSSLLCLVLWDVHKLAGKMTVTVENIDRTTIIVAGAATNLEQGARAWKANSDAQAKSASAAFGNLNASAKSMNSFIKSTNASVNSRLLPSLSKAIEDQNAATLKTQEQLQSDLARIGEVTGQTQRMLADATAKIDDPALGEAIDNIRKTTENTAEATAEGAAAISKVRVAVDYEVDELMKPVRKAKVALLFIASIAGKFFGY
jgi:DNA anti-recombination protein RmuC